MNAAHAIHFHFHLACIPLQSKNVYHGSSAYLSMAQHGGMVHSTCQHYFPLESMLSLLHVCLLILQCVLRCCPLGEYQSNSESTMTTQPRIHTPREEIPSKSVDQAVRHYFRLGNAVPYSW